MRFKLTSSQRNFYNKNFTLDSQIWNQGVMEIFPKVYSYEEINNAYNKLVEIHDSLRVKLVETENGVVADVKEHEYINYRFWQVETEEELMEKAQDFLNEPTDRYGLLVDCAIFHTPTTSGIMINAHHIVVDGYSVIVMAEHMNELLKDLNFSPVIQKYSDYVEAEEKHKQSRRFEKAKDFWLKEFSNKPDCNIFTAKDNTLDYLSNEVNSVIPKDLFDAVSRFCQENEISVTSFFNTIYGIYFSRMYETTSFTMGVPVLNRITQSEFNTIGLYMHVLPMVCNIVGDASFLHNAKQIEDSQMNLLRHQKFAQTDIKEALETIDYESNNLFSIATDYQSFTTKNEYEILIKYANYLATPLEIHLQSFNDTLHKFKIRYRTSYFNEQEIEIMLKSIVALVEDAVENPGKCINKLEMISDDEKQKLLNDFNNTTVDYVKDKCIHTLFEEQVEKTPDKIALVACDKTLTYSDLNEEVNRLANSLIGSGIGKGDIVGIKLSRTSKFLISVLGILKTGAAYLPFDITHPQERIDQILFDSDAKLCITEENFNELLDNLYTENPDIKISGNALCYCIYTSGSTGIPKGAMIQHKNLCWYMSALMSIYGTEPINMPFFTSTSVDLSIPSYFLPLMTGGTTYFYDNDLARDLSDIIDNEEINTIKVTPTHLQIILQHIKGKTLHNIKYLISGGESLRYSNCVEFLEKFGKHIEIHNEYGPTETTVSCVDYLFSLNDTDDIVSIGAPIDNAQIFIVDKHTNLLPIGVTGELCIAGDGVCAGYLNNPELTAEKFIDNPFGEGKLYKTGDLAYWREDGNICYVGRNDFQVKINGQRIELGEIENAISKVDGVVQCAVITREQYICAFYTGAETDQKDFKTLLSTKLPRYMVPHVFTHLDSLPMTVSGKLDRKALPEIDFNSLSAQTEYVAPATTEEKILIKCIETVLGVEKVSLLNNFFNIGGDSINAIYLVSELEDFGYELHITDIMQRDTLQDIAKAIKTKNKKEVIVEYKDILSATADIDIYDQNEVNGFVPFSPIMRAFLKESNGIILKDFVHTCIISADCDEKTAKKAIDILVSHHDMLRGIFTDNGIEVLPSKEREVYSFNTISIEDTEKATEYLRNTELEEDKLVNVVFCKTEKENLVSITVHHFLIDLVSWEILIKDFNTVTKQLKNNEEITLPAKTASFKLWNEELTGYSETMPQANKEYWSNTINRLGTAANFSANEENEAEEFSFTFDKVTSEKLVKEVNKAYGTRTNEVLLTALGLAAGKIAEGTVGIMVESHGRTELHKPIAIERTIGWFTSCYPVVIKNNENVVEELLNVKETMRKIPKNGIEYLLLNDGFHKNANIKFNFYRNSISNENRENKLVEFNGSSSVFPNMINVGCSIMGNTLSVLFTVPKCMHKKGVGEELGKEFIKQIEKIVEYTDILPATAAQMRIYTAHFMSNEPTLYNLTSAFKMEDLDVSRFEDAVNKLIARHEGLRTSFENRNGQVVQIINDNVSIKLEKLESSVLSDFIKPFDLTKAPLMRVGYIDNTVIVDLHHIIADGSTFGIFYEEINELYMGRELPEAVQYREFAITDTYTKEDEEYWLKEFEEMPDFELYTDYPKQEVQSDKGTNLYTRIDDKLNENILIKCKEWGVTPYDYYMSCFSILLSKYSGNEDVCVGVPSSGRSSKFLNTWGMFVNTLSIRTKPEGTKVFEDFAIEIRDKSFNAIAHQNYPQQELIKKLNIQKPLYDVMFIFQSEKMTHSVIGDKKAELLPITISSSRASIMFYILPREEDTLIRTEYIIDLYKEETIKKFIEAYIRILTQALNEETLIKEITVLSEEEKNTILKEFNDTKVDYARDKCIHELFEEQAERTPEKVAVVASDKKVTYRELNEEANKIANSLIEKGIGKGDIVGLMLPRKSYLLSALFGILKTGAAYLPIDSELPKERIEYMCKDTNARFVVSEDNIDSLLASDNKTNPNVEMTNESLCYCIYTSGSTGQPKGVMARHRNVVNYISRNEHNIFGKIIKEDFENIVSISTCSFDIFVTETIATLVNGLRVVLADEQECRNQYALNRLLTREKGHFLQTTPTKLKALTREPSQREFLRDVKAILLGGEAMEKAYLEELKKITNAKIYNIYGVTEVPIWSAFVDTDTFTDEITIGHGIANTQMYVVDKNLNPTPIGVMGELCIAGDSVSSGYLNQPELTAEKFIDNPFGEGKLYRTGDHAYWTEDGNLVFIGRKDFQVKIRGLRIELGEIESVIQAIEGIERAVVVVRKDNEDRQLICAFYTGEEVEAKDLRTILSTKLPKYMVPHIFTHLDKMPMTASGKANRNALPEIDLDNISTETEYVAPTTEEERILTKAVEKVLKAERVSILDNFFDLGGDSLEAIELTATLEEQGYTVSIKSIFEAKDIKKLAKELQIKKEKEEKVHYDSVLPATAAQMRIYTSQMMSVESVHYNIPAAFKTEELDVNRLQKAVNELIARHEGLRTSFENRNGEIVQIINDNAIIEIEELNNEDVTVFNTAFDLSKAPLFKVGYYENIVVVVAHHIIVDGESMTVLCKELNELYMGRELPETVQYGEFAVTDNYTEEDEKYWLNVLSEEINETDLPTDYPRPEKSSFKGTNIDAEIDNELNEKILNKCRQLGITSYAYYMACYNILLSKYSNNEDICVGMPISGRTSKYLNTIGMFVNTVVLRTNTEGNKTIKEFMQEVRENSISAITHQAYPFGELVKKLNKQTTNRNPLFDVMFSYQNEAIPVVIFGDKEVESVPVKMGGVKCDLNFNIVPTRDKVSLSVEYCTDLYKEETIKKFIKAYMNILTQALNEETLIKDITVLSEEEKKTIHKEFNKTEYTYDIPVNTTLYSLFEEEATKNSEKVCIKANEEEITFAEFKAYAERLDSKVRAITKEEKSVIAVICERSFEMYGAVYGIIRGGNAYLPIDPNYPQERIDYILENSKAKAVIAQDKFCHLAGNVPCIDATAVLNNKETTEKTECLAKENDTAYVIYTSGSTGNPKGAKISHKSAINRILWMHDFYPLEENDVILQKTPYTFDVSVWELFWWGITGRTLCASKPDEHFLPAKILEEIKNNKVTHLHFVPSVFDLFLTYLENNPEEQEKFNTVKYVFLSGEALTANHINRFYKIYDYNKVSLHNLYGPTECAVDVSYYACVPTDVDPVPIGKPIYNTQLHIVDKYLNPTPIGVTGELCIAGVNVGQGYLNNEELTKEKFIDNPFGEGKLYKTGDLAYWREDGQICYVGRMDGQIKLNGQRVELGEIEKVIGENPDVENVAVIIKQNNSQDVLVAFCCGDETATNEIIKHCESKLPQYMVPSKFVFIEKMPLNQSGKLDRKVLKNIEVIFDSVTVKEEPVTDAEKMICELFQKTLNIDFVGRNENFFNLGGTSLDMISVLSEDKLKYVSAAEFIAHPTPEKLAEFLDNQDDGEVSGLYALRNVKKSTKAIIFIPYAGGDASAFAALTKDLEKLAPGLSLYYVDYLRSQDECTIVAEKIAKFAETKEISIYSHCAGAAVALQLMNILEKRGVLVSNYITGGFIPPEKASRKNGWNNISKYLIQRKLIKAGAPIKELSTERKYDMVDKFRKDTDFMTEYFYKHASPINAKTSVIISKTDIFTKNYRDAERLWKLHAYNFHKVNFINSDSHYFQTEKSEEVARIIIESITK